MASKGQLINWAPINVYRLRSETAEALNELGFEYNEYIDDSDLMGDESNDEVIPPFHESDFEDLEDHDEVVNESDYVGSARAIPSKSGILYEDERLLTEAEVATSRRQSKKAPLPHHYEPSTIVGITIGAFLLIFIGTGRPIPMINGLHSSALSFFRQISFVCLINHNQW